MAVNNPIARPDSDAIDFERLGAIIRKHVLWIVLILFATNLVAYLTIRYTKDLFESESELKLDVKQDATELGIKTVMEDQNLNLVSGEIEQIKSKLFFSRLADSMDLKVSYYSVGNVLKDEMYKRSPYLVSYSSVNKTHYDVPIYFDFIDQDQYQIKIGESKANGNFNQPLSLDGTSLLINKTNHYSDQDDNEYYFILNSKQKLVEYLSENIQVEPLNFNANTIRISFRDNNALKAHDIVNNVDSLYILYSNQQKNLANKQKIEWLDKELKQVEKRMEDYENYFENFTLTNKSSDLAADLQKTILSIHKVDSQRYDLNKKLLELNAILERVSSSNLALGNQSYKFLPDNLNKRLEDLSRLTKERDRLSLAYNENTFAFQQKEQELKASKDQVFDQLNHLKTDWLNTLAELSDRKATLEKDFATMPDKNTEFSKNQRFYKLFEEFYLSMMQSKAEFEIAQAGSTPDFKILSHATLPARPISPQKFLIVGIGLVAGLVLCIFFIGILYVVNNKITSAKEVERIAEVPMLGTIPASTQIQTNFHVISNPKSVISESLRTLRTNLEFFNSTKKNQVITITSTISGEGKSFLAMNLGGILALSKKKVILLDLDMRKPKAEKNNASNGTMGMSTILIRKNKWAECVEKTSLENFDFVPSGPHPPNPAELLLNGEFTGLLDELKTHYDYVVIDTPPVGLVTDGIMAMKRSDLSIYVFRANYSRQEFIDNMLRVIRLNKLTHVSSVLNAIQTGSHYYGYGYYENESGSQNRWKKLLRMK